MDRFLSDGRSSLRIFRRSPGLAVGAVAAFAMGIGFTTTMFAIARGGTRALPFAEPEQLVVLTRTMPRTGNDFDPGQFDFLAWTRELRSFSGIGAFEMESMNLGGDSQRPERVSGANVTPGAFELLNVRPILGRTVLPEDAGLGAPAVVVLGFDLWRTRFSADSGVIGRLVRIDGEPRTVVGVMPPRFGFPIRSAIWLPLGIDAGSLPTAQGSALRVFGRLRNEVSLDQARAELAAIAARLAREHPATHGNLSARAYPFVELEMAPNTPAILYLLLGCVSFVLLIACANVANLLHARAAMRTRELAVRTALGATRSRIIILHVAESLALATAGGLLGLGIAHVAVRFFAATTANIIEAFWIDFRLDWAVILFAALLMAAGGLLAGILPGIRASGANVAVVLKDLSGGSTGVRIGRLARWLVVAEVALATGFLIMTMTFTRTAVSLRAIELPFEARQVFTGQLGLTQSAIVSVEGRERLARELTSRLDAIPGVAASALVSVVPGRGAGAWSFSLDVPSGAGANTILTTGLVVVSPGFFDVVGARVLRGRMLDWDDGAAAPGVAVVNEGWVRRFSADRDPIGRQIWLGERMLEVVGVVPDLQMQDPGERGGDGIYASMLQLRPYTIRVMARTAGDPLALTPVVRDAAEAIDPDLPLFEVATLYEAIYADKKVLDAFGALFFFAGLGALFLTMLGVYGLVSFGVTTRTREIGTRVALGASRGDIVRLVIGQGAVLIGAGTGIGLLIAFALSQALSAVAEFLQPAAGVTYVAIAGALTVTAAVGLLRPVRRALALQAMDALRRE